MRPLVVDLGRDYRGGQHQALLLLEGLRERGHAPELIALRDSELAARAKRAGVPVHEVATHWRRFAAAATIRRLIRDRRIDVAHANEPHALSSAWLARAHRAVPIVAARRIALPLSSGHYSLARYRAAARIVAISHFVERSVIQSGLPANRVSVTYDGVQIPPEISQSQRESAREHLGIPEKIPCIGNVAAFVPEKGHALLLDAFAELRAQFPECMLLLRGCGPDLPKLQSRAQQLQIASAIKFAPPSTEIDTVFAATDIFAFPSSEEPLGSALLAGMARGLPAVAFASGGIPEVIDGGKNGVLVNDHAAGAFADALMHLLSNPEEASQLGKAARQKVLANFSADRMVKDTLQLYQDLLMGDKPSAAG